MKTSRLCYTAQPSPLDPATIHIPDYPTESFPGLNENEIAKHGEYRTQRLALEAWDRLTSGTTKHA